MPIKPTKTNLAPSLRMIAWELTARCNLRCDHCRAVAGQAAFLGLSTEMCKGIIDSIAKVLKGFLLLTGGEPLMRDDLESLCAYARTKGLRVGVATNGMFLDEARAKRLLDTGVARVSISLDSATNKFHDRLRRTEGAFDGALRAAEHCVSAGLPFQFNMTVTRENLNELTPVLDLAEKKGAAAVHVFPLILTGRADSRSRWSLRRDEYHELLEMLVREEKERRIEIRPTCAPQFSVLTLRENPSDAKTRRGCLAGISFLFISAEGRVYPCSYLPVDCGPATDDLLEKTWRTSPVLQGLRDLSNYEGRCGVCRYRIVCGGCRARAYAATGSCLGSDPLCTIEM